jgi:tetratricopeptide (TPR) repeat protein
MSCKRPMPRVPVLGLAAGLALTSAVLVRAPDARAQGMEQLLEAPPGMEASPEELEAFYMAMSGRLIKAREIATKVLKQNPNSYVAHYVMGEVEHDAEANFPRAVFHFERAAALFRAKYGDHPGEDKPWRWHTRIMLSLAFAYGEIEKHEEKLTLISKYNELYEPDRLAERAWPLMKLRQFDAARKAAEEGLRTDDPQQREIALNSLCAVEFEAGNDSASYEACKRAMDNARSLGTGLDPADLMNFAEASRSVFRFDEAERIDREASEATTAWYGNPWSELGELYLREARLPEALSALKEIAKYRAQRPPHVREADRNENRRALSAFFLLLGRPDEALRITQKALVAPDRRGHNSRDPAQDRSIAALLDRAAHRLKAERAGEAAAAAPWYERLWAVGQAEVESAQAWLSGRRAVRAVGDGNRLAGSFQIGTARAAIMPPWLAGDLVHVVGPGASRAAIHESRRGDKRPQASAYYDAFEGEAAWLAGDDTAAEKFLNQAIEGLPSAEQLLRARVFAVLAKVRADRGSYQTAFDDFERAMQIDPGVVRRLGIALPVRIQVRGDDTAEDVRDALERSPRFEAGERGLVLLVNANRSGGEVCLVGPSGAQLACGHAEAKANESAEQVVTRLVADTHERLFAPNVNLSQTDANSLDGSNLRGGDQDLSPLLQDEGLLE